MVKDKDSEQYIHLIPASRDVLLQGDEKAIIKYIQSEHWIGYDRAMRIIFRLEELFLYPKRQRMPNLLITGPTNNGKTMVAKSFCLMHSSIGELKYGKEEYDNFKEIPVLYLQMPANPDVKRFYSALLNAMDIPVLSASTRISEIETDALRFMERLKVTLLIIDEIHNILAGRKDQQREFLNVLRFLGNSLRIPLVCIGTQDAYLAIRSDAQLENRFEPYFLPPWKYDSEYKSLLASFVTLMPLKRKSKLTNPKLAKKILSMSEGFIGEISTIITRAAVMVTRYGLWEIDEYVLNQIDYQSPSKRTKVFERGLI